MTFENVLFLLIVYSSYAYLECLVFIVYLLDFLHRLGGLAFVSPKEWVWFWVPRHSCHPCWVFNPKRDDDTLYKLWATVYFVHDGLQNLLDFFAFHFQTGTIRVSAHDRPKTTNVNIYQPIKRVTNAYYAFHVQTGTGTIRVSVHDRPSRSSVFTFRYRFNIRGCLTAVLTHKQNRTLSTDTSF